ncbi:MAG: hypothetical protein KAT48_14045 [Bacteroidales bacterium]|nr:hypothetical protein [Candidatus Parcubacteria bacterium]MCK4679251.1 hypothetical protein [Bacteroidales bacterium]
MFLSDKLIKIGADANPKSNLSQAEACAVMLALLNEEESKGVDQKKLINITKCAIKELNKMGFLFYKLEIFITQPHTHTG